MNFIMFVDGVHFEQLRRDKDQRYWLIGDFQMHCS